jgi:membrane associated rhomboid family serine protease
MRITYNAPVTLTFAITSSLVLVADQLTGSQLTARFFSVAGTMDTRNIVDYLRLFTHILGHADWGHLLSNFAFILLLGPILEEKYGSMLLLLMILVTALVTGLLNVLFFKTGLLGASGVVFMMILLVSITNLKKGQIPLTFILVVVLYLAREVVTAFQQDSVSQFAHIVGGLCGSLFGFMRPHENIAVDEDE